MNRGSLAIAVLGFGLGVVGPNLWTGAASADPDRDRTQRGLVRPGSGSGGGAGGGGGGGGVSERPREPLPAPGPPPPARETAPASAPSSPPPDATRRGLSRGLEPPRPRAPSASPREPQAWPQALRDDRDRTRRGLVREPAYVRPRWHDGYWRDRQRWNSWYDRRWDDDCAEAQYTRIEPWRWTGGGRSRWPLTPHAALPSGGSWVYAQDWAWRYSYSPWTGSATGFDWGGGWYATAPRYVSRSPGWSCGGLDDWWYSPWRTSRVYIFSPSFGTDELEPARRVLADPSAGRWEYEPALGRWVVRAAPPSIAPEPDEAPAPAPAPDAPASTDRERAATAIARRMALNSRYDVIPDIRAALGATSDARYAGAVTALRRAASQHPDAMVSPTGSGALMLLGSRDWTQRAKYALEVFRQPPRAAVEEADSLFSQAVLLSLLGDRDTALATIRTGISKGDTRPSTIGLAEALTDHALVQNASK